MQMSSCRFPSVEPYSVGGACASPGYKEAGFVWSLLQLNIKNIYCVIIIETCILNMYDSVKNEKQKTNTEAK